MWRIIAAIFEKMDVKIRERKPGGWGLERIIGGHPPYFRSSDIPRIGPPPIRSEVAVRVVATHTGLFSQAEGVTKRMHSVSLYDSQ